nr:MAG TPA: hypothetical protein [Caudoviricetes sp.]DAN82605.1 MAG TPA: hypothetical protein [Caudoviricetes sp.]DAO86605.1 MAG TPA: hypothetical protein [Caudoviricetes sp.]
MHSTVLIGNGKAKFRQAKARRSFDTQREAKA